MKRTFVILLFAVAAIAVRAQPVPLYIDKQTGALSGNRFNAATFSSINSLGGGGSGNVTAASNFGTDNLMLRSDGTGKGVQASGISIDDSNNIAGIAGLTAVTLTFTNIVGSVPYGNGGTDSIYFRVTGPTAARIYTFPDAAATILYSGGGLGTPASGVATNLTGTAAGLTAGSATASNATRLGSHASPDTSAGSITWTSTVYEVFTNTTSTYALPAASTYSGKAVIFYVTGTNVVTIDPNSSEVIVRDGTAQTGGVTMTLTGVAGNYVCLICDGTRWITLGYKGTLAAGS